KDLGQDLGQPGRGRKDLAQQIFDPHEWDRELIDRIVPVYAKTVADAIFTEYKRLGVDVDAMKAAAREQNKVFCPTGPGGGVDPTCSPGQSGSGGERPLLLANGGSFSSSTFYQGTAGDFEEFDDSYIGSGADQGGDSWYGAGH